MPRLISIHELIHELLATHASTARFGACGAGLHPQCRACTCGGDRGRGGQLYRTVGGPQAGQEPGANCQLDERGHREQGGDSVGPSVARGFERPAAGGGPDQKAGQRDEWADDGQLVRADQRNPEDDDVAGEDPVETEVADGVVDTGSEGERQHQAEVHGAPVRAAQPREQRLSRPPSAPVTACGGRIHPEDCRSRRSVTTWSRTATAVWLPPVMARRR